MALPTNWDELKNAARRMLKMSNDNKISVFGYRKSNNELANFIDLQLALEQLGSTSIDVDATKTSLSTTEARQALNFMVDMVQAGMPNSNGGSDTRSILNGSVAIQHMFLSYTMVEMAQDITTSGRNFKLARYVGPTSGKDLVHHNAGTLFMVSSTKYPNEAWRAMQAWIQRDNLKNYLLAHGSSLSVRLSHRTDNDLRSRPYAMEMMASLVPPITSYGPTNPYFTHFRTYAGAYLTKALKGEIAVEAALKQAEDIINTIVAEQVAAQKR